MIVCTLLNPAIDVTCRVDGFEAGATFLDAPSRAVPSGKGLNVARVVATLGEKTAVAGLIPKSDLPRFSGFIDDLGITPFLYEIPGSARVNVTLHDKQNDCVTHVNSMAASLPVRVQDEFLQFLEERAEQGAHWCFSGSVPPGFDTDVYSRIINICKSRGAATLLDTRGVALKMGARARPQILKPNLTELQEFFGEEIKGVRHIALFGKRFIDMGIDYVFISLGADGMIAIHGNDCLLCSPPQKDIKVVDTVGCGDALVAGVLVARKRKFSFTETCRLAIACGVSKSMHEGPGIVTNDEVWQIMENVKITAI
ncbi:MAG: hexose kinase [Chitinispirillales bacterium]|nr:hexose kinase [Chitinispirillales bacterium]